MKQLTFGLALLLLCVSSPTSVAAAKGEAEGKAWLDAQKEPAAFSVNGTWESEEWGTFHLVQTDGSRDVRGNGGGYEITGVVSGNQLFMLFISRRALDYCATLSSNGVNTLIGSYANRKTLLRSGDCRQSTRPMNMKRQ